MRAAHLTYAWFWLICGARAAHAGFNEGDPIGPSGLELLIVGAFGIATAPMGFLLTYFGMDRVYKVLVWVFALCVLALVSAGIALAGDFAVLLVIMAAALIVPAFACLYLGACVGRTLRDRKHGVQP